MGLDVGEKIKNLRINKGLTQDELADRLGISRHLVSKWELGQRLPGYDAVEMMAEYFDVEPELLILGDSTVYEELDSCIPRGMNSETASKLIDEFSRSLDKRDREIFLLRYVRFMSSKGIARKIGKGYGTVRNRLVVIRKTLREFLDRCV